MRPDDITETGKKKGDGLLRGNASPGVLARPEGSGVAKQTYRVARFVTNLARTTAAKGVNAKFVGDTTSDAGGRSKRNHTAFSLQTSLSAQVKKRRGY